MQSIRFSLRAVLCAALIFLSTGCASLTELFGELEEFYRAQGTAIFAKQNKVILALIRMREVSEARKKYEVARQLSEVEEKLDETCLPLQRVSYLKLMGEKVDSNLSNKAYRSYDSCEEATLEAKDELYRIAPKLAAQYLKP